MPQPDGLVIIGLTDESAPGVDGIAPPVPEADERFLLETLNRVLDHPLRPADIVGRYAGLRPLVQRGASAVTADVSRRHLLVDEPGRPLTITGGKLTTYRQMAHDTVDAVCRRAGSLAPARTRAIPLVGAAPRDVLARVAAPSRLVRRYGLEAVDVAALGRAHPDLLLPVSDSCPTLGVEFLFGALHEGAFTVEDLVERRTRTSLDEAALPAARALAERALDRAADLTACTATG
jgi:glycerol-3-phosphate dehydrogenase